MNRSEVLHSQFHAKADCFLRLSKMINFMFERHLWCTVMTILACMMQGCVKIYALGLNDWPVGCQYLNSFVLASDTYATTQLPIISYRCIDCRRKTLGGEIQMNCGAGNSLLALFWARGLTVVIPLAVRPAMPDVNHTKSGEKPTEHSINEASFSHHYCTIVRSSYQAIADLARSSCNLTPLPGHRTRPIFPSHRPRPHANNMDVPPPPYEEAAGLSSSSNRPAPMQNQSQGNLKVRNGIPPSMRRSMEDEGRPLPEGWVRSYDPENDHQFYVDTTKDPPRSIWRHPYDDNTYVNSLSEKERARIRSMHRALSDADIAAESSDDDDHHHHSDPSKVAPTAGKPGTSTSMTRSSNDEPKSGASRLGRKLKDKITNSTHQEREAQRKERSIQEQQLYEQHRMVRQAMVEASRTGQPQFIGKDPRTGQDLYLEPPNGPQPPPGANGFNPYAQGPYANPNAKFLRPRDPYSRPYGGGYGGGYGLPLAGGLMGGLLLGDMMMMGGGFGGGFGGGGM